uniref:COesterase domain-containing protein n=1 Tax=Caenorhabditis tropicalis TaxID=1561998 RepID=A0A1I7TZ49_9PELO
MMFWMPPNTDAIEALNYVNEEIDNYGGNPKDVTIMGHSSGGQLVDSLGFSSDVDPGKKLFQKFIVLSAHPMFGFKVFKLSNSFEIARRFNCVSESQQEIVDCLRKIDAKELLGAQKAMEEIGMLFKSILAAPPLMDLYGKISDLKKNAPPRKMLRGVTEHEFEKFKYSNYRVNGKFLDFENPVEVIMTYRNNFTYKTPNLLNSDTSAVFVAAATNSEALVNAGGEVYLFETRQKPYSMHVSDMQYFIGIHRELDHTSDMDILDSFYSKLLVNFTKYGNPSPYWDKLDPEKMNFLALEIDTENGVVPKMEDGFHEELVNFWMIDMMELDRNITEQKQKSSHNVTPAYTTVLLHTTTSQIVSNVTQSTAFYNVTAIPFNDPPVTPESFPIYNQWWFYAVLVVIVILASVIILICLRKPSPEIQPLLA